MRRVGPIQLLSANTKQLPKEILYPTEFFPHGDSAQQQLIDKFVQLLERFLGVKKTSFTLAKRWDENPPIEAEGKSLAEYAHKVWMQFQIYTVKWR